MSRKEENILRKLSRQELLEMLIESEEHVRQLEEELAEAKEQLENRRIQIENSGSIAEAALKLNGIFEAAQAAANQYLENLGVPTGAKEALEQPTALESQQMETGREEE